jgi:hypothetical protein
MPFLLAVLTLMGCVVALLAERYGAGGLRSPEAEENPMNSLRATNVLLAIIAACLLAIVAKDFVPAILPAAQAQITSDRVSIYGCWLNGINECEWKPVLVTPNGALVTQVRP